MLEGGWESREKAILPLLVPQVETHRLTANTQLLRKNKFNLLRGFRVPVKKN
jgi:hypothetical protein